ncbi:efflux RND transporter periplasmic adaptor subunit [Rhizomicrobium electricum]|jgi:multidrug efflux system membrane fusion protein|uniref:Efflux RND transporter periplasmic adaptor subunit n=1 Tax=Rhizomicrobium electricum TaxID=480070 RepID=A0ABN1EUA3_9PROT|nr:efflux RND transporter periplasmic adaptor subunit [Rhizomicrobium electricum]NIJ49627.1 multidrug efflux system membrane fusion protein [Rhizomicrobium electricum]
MVAIVRKHPRVFLAAALGALLALPFVFGVGTTAKAAQGAPQAVPVGVARVEPHDVQLWSQFSGRLNAVDYAEIRPEVGGRITEVRFKDGQIVKAGQVLLVIDPRPYEATLAKARADLASARANAALAKTELERGNGLIKANAIARSMYDQRVNAHQVAIANVAVAEAAVRQAAVDVDHAYVKAPITGRISRPELTIGNLVQTAPNAPLLASIVSNDGIYADFEVDEQTYLSTVHARAETAADEQQLPVEMTVQGTEGHAYKGMVYSFDNKIDTGSGTIRARAKFANADGSLVPGMFVSVRLGAGDHRHAITVPERAIVADLNKKFVYIVGKGQKAEMREIQLGAANDGERVVLSGLKTGDQVIVDGVQHVAMGAPVLVQSKIASR